MIIPTKTTHPVSANLIVGAIVAYLTHNQLSLGVMKELNEFLS